MSGLLICTYGNRVWGIGEIYSEGDFHAQIIQHIATHDEHHAREICVIFPGDEFWEEVLGDGEFGWQDLEDSELGSWLSNEFSQEVLSESASGWTNNRIKVEQLSKRMQAKAKKVLLPTTEGRKMENSHELLCG